MGPRGPKLNWNKFTVSCEFGTLQVKWWYHMFSSIKMEEYMESELSGIFWVKLVRKNIVLGSLGTHFMHMRVNKCLLNVIFSMIKALNCRNSPKENFHSLHFSSIWKTLVLLMLVFLSPSLFHFKLYRISSGPTPVVISWFAS